LVFFFKTNAMVQYLQNANFSSWIFKKIFTSIPDPGLRHPVRTAADRAPARVARRHHSLHQLQVPMARSVELGTNFLVGHQILPGQLFRVKIFRVRLKGRSKHFWVSIKICLGRFLSRVMLAGASFSCRVELLF
jgi:hypothetical protein